MKILHFSTDDITGGAALAAYRLHTALRAAGQQSRLLVRHKKSDDDDVTQLPPPPPRPWQSRLDRVRQALPGLRRHTPTARYTFNFDLEPLIDEVALFAIPREEVDVICLHWITGLLNARLIRRLYEHYRCPLVWVLADQEPMTGGCHYSFGCDGYTRQCGHCPQLDAPGEHDASRRIWENKRRYLADVPIVFVSPTRWGMERVRASSLFKDHRLEKISVTLDAEVFRPFNQQAARDLLRLPQDKRILFIGATYLEDPRKGMPLLLEALRLLPQMMDTQDVYLLVAGLNSRELLDALPLPYHYVGLLRDTLTLALAYQAADLFVCPSIEDGGPMMISEAMLCGAPVVAFDSGIAPELIRTGETGYLARYRDVEDLARGIGALLNDERLPLIRAQARERALATHAPQTIVRKYCALYQDLIETQTGRRAPALIKIGVEA